MIQLIRLFAIMMMVVTMGFATTSCSDDDEPSIGVADYYIECTNVTCSDWTTQECVQYKNFFNVEVGFSDIVMNGYKLEDAIDVFEETLWDIKTEFSKGVSDVPTGGVAYFEFSLKNSETGVVVSKKTLVLTDHNSSIQ